MKINNLRFFLPFWIFYCQFSAFKTWKKTFVTFGKSLFFAKITFANFSFNFLLGRNFCEKGPKSRKSRNFLPVKVSVFIVFRAKTYFKSKKIYVLRKKNTPISYSTMRSTLLSYLKELGLQKKLFGTHSLRRGGATSAANKDVNNRLFQNHGSWKSVRAKDDYVKDNLNSLLSVSRSLDFEWG